MKRRDFITVLAGATGWISVAHAGDSSRRVGILGGGSKEAFVPFVAGFVKGLNDTGFIKGRNVTMDDRWADGHYDRLPSLAAELLGRDSPACLPRGSLGSGGEDDNQNDPDRLHDWCRSG